MSKITGYSGDFNRPGIPGPGDYDYHMNRIVDRHRIRLEKNFIFSPSVYEILKNQRLLPLKELNEIYNERSNQRRVRKLLDYYRSKSDGRFKHFLRILRLTGHNWLADDIDRDMAHAEYDGMSDGVSSFGDPGDFPDHKERGYQRFYGQPNFPSDMAPRGRGFNNQYPDPSHGRGYYDGPSKKRHENRGRAPDRMNDDNRYMESDECYDSYDSYGPPQRQRRPRQEPIDTRIPLRRGDTFGQGPSLRNGYKNYGPQNGYSNANQNYPASEAGDTLHPIIHHLEPKYQGRGPLGRGGDRYGHDGALITQRRPIEPSNKYLNSLMSRYEQDKKYFGDKLKHLRKEENSIKKLWNVNMKKQERFQRKLNSLSAISQELENVAQSNTRYNDFYLVT